jgi:exopolyphosphatase/guanosine-5'-triphosphate,3'-diphosphate pyrophosphatase
LLRLAVLLRVAVALHRGRHDLELDGLRVEAGADSLSLLFPPGWLDHHPLTAADLSREQAYLNNAGILLRFQ